MATAETCFDLLRHGHWTEGLALYEDRFNWPQFQHAGYRALGAPLWQGEPLDGKTLYVAAEQGVGDILNFSRYLGWLKATWPTCRVVFGVAPGLLYLFAVTYARALGVELCVSPAAEERELARADYAVWLCSLLRLHGTTPENVYPDPGLFRAAFPPKPSTWPPRRVCFCNTANPAHPRDSERSIGMAEFAPLLDTAWRGGMEWWFPPSSGAWDETARAVGKCDLVVTVDTAVGHLAGVLGVPCWLLVPEVWDWRWLEGREDSVWYPTHRLWRQEKKGDWSAVLRRVREELEA